MSCAYTDTAISTPERKESVVENRTLRNRNNLKNCQRFRGEG